MGRRGLFAASIAPLGLPGLAFFTRRRAGGEAEPGKPFAVTCTDGDWRSRLTAAQYRILRRHGTEAPWSSRLDAEKRHGTYGCAGCGQALFASATKFQSGTGWPSFWESLPGAIGTSTDRSFLMKRTEVHCSTCGGHLGHIFADGPRPTGLRYCMNGAALTFAPAEAEPT